MFYIDGKEYGTDVGYCLDLANPILEIINKKEVLKDDSADIKTSN